MPLVINARTDLYLIGTGTPESRFEETVRLARAYLGAGAGCIYPIGVLDAPTIAALVKTISAPVNVIGKPGGLGFDALGQLGVARVSTAITPVLAVMSALQRMAGDLRKTGSSDAMASELTYPEVQRLFSGG